MSRDDDEIIDEYYIEDTWKCSSCGTECLGHELRCKECGSPKEKSETYKTGDINKRVTDATKLKEAKAGPNRTCPFCKADNHIFEGSCLECGARVEEQAPKPTQPRTGAPKAQGGFTKPTAPAVLKKAYFRSEQRGPLLAILGGVLMVTALVGGGYALFKTHLVIAQVASRSWSVTKTVEQRFTKHDDGWGTPLGAFNTSCETRIRGYIDCHPHDCDPYQKSYDCHPHKCNCSTYTTTSSGRNGYSKVSVHRSCDTCYDTCSRTAYHTCYERCADYSDWCSYDFYSWDQVDRRTSEGTGCEVTEPEIAAVELQRVRQVDRYAVEFAGEKKTWNYTPRDRSEFMKFCASSQWNAEVSFAGGFTPISPR